MKTILFLFLFIPFFFVNSNNPEILPCEGAWKNVYIKSVHANKVVYQLPGNTTGGGIKIWTKNQFVFVGKYDIDSTIINSYGGGTYKLEGNRYEENLLYHTNKKLVGQKIRMLMEFKNDTMIQIYPVGADGKIDKSNYTLEKLVRSE